MRRLSTTTLQTQDYSENVNLKYDKSENDNWKRWDKHDEWSEWIVSLIDCCDHQI